VSVERRSIATCHAPARPVQEANFDGYRHHRAMPPSASFLSAAQPLPPWRTCMRGGSPSTRSTPRAHTVRAVASYNNPAARLHALLLNGAKIPNNTTVWEAWAQILGLGDDVTLGDCIQHLGPVYTLPGQIRTAVAASPELNQELLLRHLPTVERYLETINLHTSWEASFRHQIDMPIIESIEHVADDLARVRPERTLDESTLHRLHKEVRALFDEVAQADLEDDLRESLLFHLGAMDDALRQVKTRGIVAFRYAVEAAVGSEILRITQSGPLPEAGPRRKFWVYVARAALALGLVNQGLALPAAVDEAIDDDSRPPALVVQVNDDADDVAVEIDGDTAAEGR
jgi:hypothetical protein